MPELAMNTMWDIGMPNKMLDDGTVDLEYVQFEPHGTNVSGKNEFKLYSDDQSSFYLPPSAMLQVNFNVSQSDDTTVEKAADAAVALGSNGFLMFQRGVYKIQDVEINSIEHPGVACHMHLLTNYSKEYIDTVAKQAHVYVDSWSDLGSTSQVNSDLISPYTLTVDATNSNAVTAVEPNVRYDQALIEKLERQIKAQTSGQAAVDQQVLLPLRWIFPALNTDKVLQGSKIEFEFVKNNLTTAALFGDDGGAGNFKLTINRVRLWIARVRPTVDALSRFKDQLSQKPSVEHEYENMKLYFHPAPQSANSDGTYNHQLVHNQNRPTRLVCGFQLTGRRNETKLNPLKFDLLGTESYTSLTHNVSGGIKNISVRHNGTQVPGVQYSPTTADEYVRIVQEIYRVGNFEMDSVGSCPITYENWKKMYPLFVFDLSAIEGSAYQVRDQSTIKIEWEIASGINSNYNLYSLLYSEAESIYNYEKGITTVRTT